MVTDFLFAVPISFEGIQEIQDAQEEKDATIQCKVKGMPEPKISWYFNGQQIICKCVLINSHLNKYEFIRLLFFVKALNLSFH